MAAARRRRLRTAVAVAPGCCSRAPARMASPAVVASAARSLRILCPATARATAAASAARPAACVTAIRLSRSPDAAFPASAVVPGPVLRPPGCGVTSGNSRPAPLPGSAPDIPAGRNGRVRPGTPTALKLTAVGKAAEDWLVTGNVARARTVRPELAAVTFSFTRVPTLAPAGTATAARAHFVAPAAILGQRQVRRPGPGLHRMKRDLVPAGPDRRVRVTRRIVVCGVTEIVNRARPPGETPELPDRNLTVSHTRARVPASATAPAPLAGSSGATAAVSTVVLGPGSPAAAVVAESVGDGVASLGVGAGVAGVGVGDDGGDADGVVGGEGEPGGEGEGDLPGAELARAHRCVAGCLVPAVGVSASASVRHGAPARHGAPDGLAVLAAAAVTVNAASTARVIAAPAAAITASAAGRARLRLLQSGVPITGSPRGLRRRSGGRRIAARRSGGGVRGGRGR